MLDLYRAQIKVALATYFQYRVGVTIWIFVRVVEPLIYMAVWAAVVAENGARLNGYTAPQIAAYYIVLMVVNQVTFAKIIWRYDSRIRYGTLSTLLLHPAPLIHRDVADNLAVKLLVLPAIALAALLMTLAFQPAFSLTPTSVLLFLGALISAYLLNFFVDYVVAMFAFWTTYAAAVERLFSMAIFFFSGRIAPLEMLPTSLRLVADMLPFRWILAFPVDVLLGRLTFEQTMTGFAIQGIWLALAVGVTLFGWRAGVRRYAAVGG